MFSIILWENRVMKFWCNRVGTASIDIKLFRLQLAQTEVR